MKALKHCIDKLKRVISMILDWFMEVIMSVKRENEAIINRKYDFYEFLISIIIDTTKDGVKNVISNKRLCLAIGVGALSIPLTFLTLALYQDK